MDNTIYYVLGGVAVVYILISMFNKKKAGRGKSRGVREGYERRDKWKEVE
jgi:hypothetical protein